jgi:hypothetical protein
VFGGCELDDVGCEEVAGDYEEEGEADEDVMAFVVVASEADENSILCGWSALIISSLGWVGDWHIPC